MCCIQPTKKMQTKNAGDKAKRTHKSECAFWERQLAAGPLGGIRTPDLQNRNLLRYPAAPQAEVFALDKH